MKITLGRVKNNTSANIATRCPHCGHHGTFEQVTPADLASMAADGSSVRTYLGIRRCPNKKCHGHIFFISDSRNNLLQISPAHTIHFDSQNIPETVLAAFEEAVKCHSNNCFIASAIMIRKALEEICRERGAKGKNLQDRLKDLGSKILIPKELLEGMDELRLLGNDAAHVEARTFNDIGSEEIEISLDFSKEILKAVYQYDSLLQRLKGLKKKNEDGEE